MRFPATPWLIAFLAFLILGISRGLHSSFGVLYVALLESFGWGRGVTAGVFSVVLFVDAVLSPIVGHLLDCYGPKRVVGGGCLVLALGLFLSSQIRELWELYLFFGLVVAFGFTFTGMVPHVVLISEWFASNRASAFGLVYAGTGIGILLLSPFTEWLLSAWGWQGTLQTQAILILVLMFPLVIAFYQRGPHRERSGAVGGGENQWTAKLALQSGQFWLLFFGRVFAAGGTTVIVTHQVAHVVDIGYTRFYAATIFGFVGVTSTCGRLIFGYVADLFSKQLAYTLNILTTIIGVGALMVARDTSQTWLLYIYLLFFGIGFGSRAVIFSALAADIFSGKRFGAILGYSVVSVGLGGALGSWLGGVFYDLSGSYVISFALSTIVLILSDVCIWLAPMRWVVSYDQRLWSRDRDTRQR
jgi:MFS family permease